MHFYITKLNKYPTISIPIVTTAIKAIINLGFNTLRRITISGNDKAITDIIKANTVASAAPLPSRASTIGIIPAALEYIGTPIIAAYGIDQPAPFPIMATIKSCGT